MFHYFADIIQIEGFDVNNILFDGKWLEDILIYGVS